MEKFISACGVIIVAIIAGACLQSCQIVSDNFTKQTAACVNVGGQWVPAGSSVNYQCLRTNK